MYLILLNVIRRIIQNRKVLSALNLFEPQVDTDLCDLRYYIILFYVYILFGLYTGDLSSTAVCAKVIFPFVDDYSQRYLHRFDPSRQANKKLHIEDTA